MMSWFQMKKVKWMGAENKIGNLFVEVGEWTWEELIIQLFLLCDVFEIFHRGVV